MPISTSSSYLHMSKISTRHQPPSISPSLKARPVQPHLTHTSSSASMISNDSSYSSSRSSSLAGKKRPRETEDVTKARISRRTKSTSDARLENRSTKDKEAFQRGLIAVFVPKALQESAQGNWTHYNDLLAHFLPTATAPVPALPPLLPLLRAITSHVSLLSPELHSSLVSAIIGLPWATGDERFVKSFVGWAGVLVSSQQGWAKEVVGMAVKGLTWQRKFTASSSMIISRRVFHARHHLLLSHLLSLIPTLPNVLQPLLVRHFPNKREPEVAQTTWVRNCCELMSYCPELGGRIWSGIVDRMLRMDVEITNSVDDDESDDEEDSIAGDSRSSPVLDIDPFDLLISQDLPVLGSSCPTLSDEEDNESDPDPDDLSSADGDHSDEELADETRMIKEREKKKSALKLMREKLDGMLCHFFEHLEESMGDKSIGSTAAEFAAQSLSTSSSGTSTPTSEIITPAFASVTPRRPPPTAAQSLAHFQTLLNLFSRQILPTSSTQHIPFLLFLCSSFSAAHTDLFLGLLVSQALYATSSTLPGAQPVSINQRIAATVYIGSVVCRARFVSDDQARMVTTYLLAYIDGKLHQSRAKMDELPLFYAVCQAVMLIFCFRWRAFTSDKEKEKDEGVLGEMDMESEEGEGEEGGGVDGKWMRDLDILQKAITSDLNPLLGCNSTIVTTFAKVAHQTNFAYCFSIIESNQLSSLRTVPPAQTRTPSSTSITSKSSSQLPRQARQHNIDAGLDSYFPFDPYDLPRSKRFVVGLYREWDEVAVDLGDDSDEDSDDEDQDDEDLIGSDIDSVSEEENKLPGRAVPKSIKSGSLGDARRRLMKDGGLSSSLEGMSISISPVRPKGVNVRS